MASSSSSNSGRFSTLRAREAAEAPLSDVLDRLGANASRGLTSQLVEDRRRVHGLNEFTIKENDPLWRKYLNQVYYSTA
jgi:Ca2+-transporting ATPase